MKYLLIRLLFKLIDNPGDYSDIDSKRIEKWLAEQGKQQGFRDYWRRRDLQLLKAFGCGPSEEALKLLIGQRLELFKMMDEVQKAIKVEEKYKEKLKNEKAK
jgi:hypothetical protein